LKANGCGVWRLRAIFFQLSWNVLLEAALSFITFSDP